MGEHQGRLEELEQQLADIRMRWDHAEHLANMGDYDWQIASDTNRWSDQLFRIYGYEPGAFNATYDKFLEHIHPDDRERITAIHQHAHATGEPYQMIERIVRPDGETRYLSSNGEVVLDEDGTPVRMWGTCVDITEQVLAERAREEAAGHVARARALRRAAMELNDNVVQGLVAAMHELESDDTGAARRHLEATLDAARSMMEDLLDPSDPEGLRAGDLVREQPATERESPRVPVQPGAAPAGRRSVLLVDDAADLRALFRTKFEREDRYAVVGEAADGLEAVEKARELQPDLVLLDMAMPRMDGLQALPLIREAAPNSRVVVLSGFNESTMAHQALAAGAVRYLVKGCSLSALVSAVDEVFVDPVPA